MRVVDQKCAAWFLLEHDGALFLDTNCNHGVFGYSWLIELSPAERRGYQQGRAIFIDRLAEDIHNSVPILDASQSPYKDRNRDAELGDRVTEAVKAWREGRAQT